MHKSTPAQRKKLRLYAAITTVVVAIGSIAAVLVAVGPAQAQSLAHSADTQVAVFMVPLTLLVLAMLFEVARIALRGALPEEEPPPRSIRHWQPGRGEG